MHGVAQKPQEADEELPVSHVSAEEHGATTLIERRTQQGFALDLNRTRLDEPRQLSKSSDLDECPKQVPRVLPGHPLDLGLTQLVAERRPNGPADRVFEASELDDSIEHGAKHGADAQRNPAGEQIQKPDDRAK